MKKIFFLSCIGLMGLGILSCNNGDYDANPDMDNSGAVNPYNPGGGSGGGGSSFNWTIGSSPISAKVDGEAWEGDVAEVVEALGIYNFLGEKTSDGSQMIIQLQDSSLEVGEVHEIQMGNIDNMVSLSFWKDANDINSIYIATKGGVKILEITDTQIKGLFYFTGINQNQSPINITEGYFNATKF